MGGTVPLMTHNTLAMNKKIQGWPARMSAYFNLSPYLVTQAEAEASIREGVSFRGTNIIILVMAIFIASLGLNINSTAVIIGAMLISPLMGPIIGLGLGVGIQDFNLMHRSLRNLLIAALFSVATSTLFFLISPVGQNHSELLARTSPTIYDVLIGFFGGGAGIMAVGSRSKGNVIPGVAIATALMPPLCTVGYGLATLQPVYFFGALYLFIINSIYICLATFIGVKVMKYKAAPVNNHRRAKQVRRVVYAVAVVALLPSVYLTYNMLRESQFEHNARQFVSEQCRFPDTHLLSSHTSWSSQERVITLTLIGRTLPQDSLVAALSSRLGFYHLEGTRLNIVQGNRPEPDAVPTANASTSDIYRISQVALAQKQNTIDSLRHVVNEIDRTNSQVVHLMPELKVIFPQIKEIAVSRTLLANADSSRVDTLDVALVATERRLPAAKQSELARYLEARLRLRHISIVPLPGR